MRLRWAASKQAVNRALLAVAALTWRDMTRIGTFPIEDGD